jgi:polyisoprenoid-binding protein YceI
MNKGQFLVGPTVRAAVVATLAMTGWMACSNPADNVPAAAVADPVAAPEAQATGSSLTYTLAEATTISFTGSKITGIHEGGFSGFEGTITMVEGDPLRSSMQLTIDTSSMWTDSDKLTGHLKSSDFFDVENHPTATFTSTEIVPAAEGYVITGNLDLHGITHSITFPAAIEIAPDTVTAKAEFSLMRFDFGIVYPGKKDDLIRDEVVVKFDLVATPAGEQDA